MLKELIIKFFARMEHLYGSKWISVYGKPVATNGTLTTSARQWMHDLAPYSEQRLTAAMERMETLYPEWPPTVPQFKILCDRLPNVEEIIDRETDHGPVCALIRSKLDWYNLTLLPSKEMRITIQRKMIEILPELRRSGQISQAALSHEAVENFGVLEYDED